MSGIARKCRANLVLISVCQHKGYVVKFVSLYSENLFTLQWIRSILKRWRGRFCDWTKRAIEARLLDIVYVYKALCRSFYNIGALLSSLKLLSIVLKTILRVRMPMTLQF